MSHQVRRARAGHLATHEVSAPASFDQLASRFSLFPTCGSSSSAPPDTSWSSQLLPSGAKPAKDHLDDAVDEDGLDEGADEVKVDLTCSCFWTFDLGECSGLLAMETSVSRSS